MDPENNRYVGLNPYWSGEDEQYENCECPGPPPPQFVIPPPPAPPSLQLCQNQHSDLQYCDVRPLGAEYTHPAFPSLPVIAVCSSVVLVAILVVSFLLWKHKKKVQNFLPCKSDHQPPCDIPGPTGVPYDDVLISHHPPRIHGGSSNQTLTSFEQLLDVRYRGYGAPQLTHPNFTFSNKEIGNVRSNKNKEHFNPIYEEVSGGSEDKGGSRSGDSDIDDSETEARITSSEDEFAEDELSLAEFPRESGQVGSITISLQGSTGEDLCPDVASGSSEGALTDHSDSRELRGLFRGNKSGSSKRKNSGLSLERNRNGHASDGSEAKQHYYLHKNANGPDISYPNLPKGSVTHLPLGSLKPKPHPITSGTSSNAPAFVHDPGYSRSGHKGIHSSHQSDRRTQKRTESSPSPLPSPYDQDVAQAQVTQSPHSSTPRSKSGRLPGAVLSELNQRLSGSVKKPGLYPGNQPRNIPSTDNPRSAGPPELGTFRPGGRNIPNADNIYASIDEDGLYAVDGSHKNTSRNPADSRQNFDRRGVPKDSNKTLASQNIPSANSAEQQESYGDIRPVNDSRTIGT
ncbi:uncharacterized protein LOC143252290 isoform X2 [Tachypleus tridentatus]|uniref:uncharacterized protein LOC143252290 isoform X2 n=1 Tax=Tachypleus tridentatus TaxID=6853 RepID=UPI003FD2C8BE